MKIQSPWAVVLNHRYLHTADRIYIASVDISWLNQIGKETTEQIVSARWNVFEFSSQFLSIGLTFWEVTTPGKIKIFNHLVVDQIGNQLLKIIRIQILSTVYGMTAHK